MNATWERTCSLVARLVRTGADVLVEKNSDLFVVAMGEESGCAAEIEDCLQSYHGVPANEARWLGRLYDAIDYVVIEGADREWVRRRLASPVKPLRMLSAVCGARWR
jgi:hypothetical protein